ncbi:24923_t:CDS:2, partial [Racocetra persica]
MKTTFNERDIETFLETKLRKLATKEQKKKLKGKRADYILYQTGTTNPLVIIEVKGPSENIHQALEQGINYARDIGAPLVIATNGEFTKTYHTNFCKTLTRNGEEVKDLFTEQEALQFNERPRLITQENKGEERFSEFANILFLKIISEIEAEKQKSAGELFSHSKIKNIKSLERIISQLNPLCLAETERDIKGEAFEYFLQRYNAGGKDLVARATKMNFILFGDGHNNIQQRDSFQYPVEDKYELVITNIPFGFDQIDYGSLYPINCEYGDCLALQHCLKACKSKGRVAMIMPEGFFNQRSKKGYRETKKWLIKNYSIQAIISLPKGIFLPYTGSKSSIIIIENSKRTRDYFYYYQIKNDGFTLNNHRDRIEGIYYRDIENDKYNLLVVPPNFSLLKKTSKSYLLLSEIAELKRGCYELKREEFANSGYAKVYQPSHAISGDFSSGNRYISEERYQQLKKYELQVNDIIMSVSGTWGKKQRGEILPQYLLAVLQSPNLKKFFLDNSLAKDVMENLRIDHLKEIPVPIISLTEQEKVVQDLEKIKESIRNTQKTIDNLAIATFEYGYTISASKQGEFRLIRITDIDEYGNISDRDKKYVDLTNESDKKKYLLKENDILMARIELILTPKRYCPNITDISLKLPNIEN